MFVTDWTGINNSCTKSKSDTQLLLPHFLPSFLLSPSFYPCLSIKAFSPLTHNPI